MVKYSCCLTSGRINLPRASQPESWKPGRLLYWRSACTQYGIFMLRKNSWTLWPTWSQLPSCPKYISVLSCCPGAAWNNPKPMLRGRAASHHLLVLVKGKSQGWRGGSAGKGTCQQALWPECDPWNPDGGRGESTLTSCSLTSK